MHATVFVRHSQDCPRKANRYYRGCRCPKWLAVSDDRGFTRTSAKTRSWEKAVAKARALETPAAKTPASDERTSIETAVNKFLKNKQIEGVAEGSYYNQELVVRKQFLAWTKNKPLVYLDEIRLEHLEQFRASLPCEAATRRYKQSLLRGFFKYCVLHNWIESNPALGLSRIKVRQQPTGYFLPQEFSAIRTAAASYYRRQDLDCAPLNARLLAFVDCLRWSGLRIGDGIQLKRTKLDRKNRIQLHMEKTGEHVSVLIPDSVAEAMRMLPGKRYFFWDGQNYKGALRNYEYTLKTLFARAGVAHGHAHMLRDTFAVELLLAGMSLDHVSKLLGHTSIKTTEKHYGPWVKARQQQLETSIRAAWERMEVPEAPAMPIVQ